MRKALLTASAVIALCGCTGPAPAPASADGPCSGEAYHGRHEQCLRSYVVSRHSGDFILENRYDFADLIQSGANEDWYDARKDWMRLRPNPAEIGMSADEVLHDTMWGPPWHINSSETASGTREQWVYQWPEGGFMGFLYFENGKLVTIQTDGARH
jgi:hypothetical protein